MFPSQPKRQTACRYRLDYCQQRRPAAAYCFRVRYEGHWRSLLKSFQLRMRGAHGIAQGAFTKEATSAKGTREGHFSTPYRGPCSTLT